MASVTYTVNTTTRDMIFKQYTTMTVNSGDTVTVDSYCRGMFFYVQGDCTINGSIRMDATNASGNTGGTNIAPGFDPATTTSSSDSASVSADGLRLPMVTSGGSQTLAAADFAGCGTAVVNGVANQGAISSNGTIFQILRNGGAGGASSSHSGSFGSIGAGNPGTAGATGAAIISAGGGGTGGKSSEGPSRTSGAGGTGSCFGGGGASGGSSGSSSGSSSAASWSHGAGGNTSGGGWWGQYSGHGGPGAGTIILVVGGDLTIGASANITCNGGSGGSGQYGYVAGGGGGAGGVILILYAGALSNSGTITCSGSAGASGGATGAAGGVHIAQVTY